MATIPGFTAITGANVTTSDKTYIADVSAADPQDRSITMAELVAFLGANGLILTSTKDQPNGVPGLNASSQIVGPILLSTYANAAAAGVLDDGELGVVADKLHLGDGSTTGGVRVGGVTPGSFTVNTTGSITLDPFSGHAVIRSTMVNDALTITISNIADLPVGYLLYVYATKTGSADQFTINDSVLNTITIGAALTSLIIGKLSDGWTVLQNTSV